MKNFKQNKRSGGRKDFGAKSFGQRSSGGRDFGGRDNRDRDRERPQMHKATCAECGRKCEVPFKPTDGRPVLCSDCFGNSRENNRETPRRPERNSFSRSSFEEKPMYSAVCAECGDDCEVPFKPTGDRPVLCSNCFGSSKPARSEGNSNLKIQEQLYALDAKLDKILKILSAAPAANPAPAKPAEAETAEIGVKKDRPGKPAKKTVTKKEAKTKKTAKKTAAGKK